MISKNDNIDNNVDFNFVINNNNNNNCETSTKIIISSSSSDTTTSMLLSRDRRRGEARWKAVSFVTIIISLIQKFIIYKKKR